MTLMPSANLLAKLAHLHDLITSNFHYLLFTTESDWQALYTVTSTYNLHVIRLQLCNILLCIWKGQ